MSGYWSNLSKGEGMDFEKQPHLKEMVHSATRCNGLYLLDIKPEQIGVDYGCGWGALLVSAATQCEAMIGIDYTASTVDYLEKRLVEEGVQNAMVVQRDLREDIILTGTTDFAIVNGVLEWLAVEGDVELPQWFKRGRPQFVEPRIEPREIQLKFLRMVRRNLRTGGKLYLAIENRWATRYMYKRDNHTGLMWTTYMPRGMSNLVSNLWYGRPYVEWTYSLMELLHLLIEAGFNKTECYGAYPDYRFPKRIVELGYQRQYGCPAFITISEK